MCHEKIQPGPAGVANRRKEEQDNLLSFFLPRRLHRNLTSLHHVRQESLWTMNMQLQRNTENANANQNRTKKQTPRASAR